MNHIRPISARRPVAAQAILPLLFDILSFIGNFFSTILLIDEVGRKKQDGMG